MVYTRENKIILNIALVGHWRDRVNNYREFIHLSDYDLVNEIKKSSLEENPGRFVALRFEYTERLNEMNLGPQRKQIVKVIVLGLSLAALTVLQQTDFKSLNFPGLIDEFPKIIPIVIGLGLIVGYFRKRALRRSKVNRTVHPSGFRILAENTEYQLTGKDYLKLTQYVDPKTNAKLWNQMRYRGLMLGRFNRKNLRFFFAFLAILFVAWNAVLQQSNKPKYVAPQGKAENFPTPTKVKIMLPIRYSLVSVAQSKCLSDTAGATDCRNPSAAVFQSDGTASENVRLALGNNSCLALTISDNWYLPAFEKCSDSLLQKFTFVEMSDKSLRIRYLDKGCLALQNDKLKFNKCNRDVEMESFAIKAAD